MFPDLSAGGFEVWTLNDWYQFYSWEECYDLGWVPSRVFNLHFAPHTHESDSSRFQGDWKGEYNHVIRAGGRVVVVDPIAGVDVSGQELLPRELAQVFPLCAMTCTVSTMICYAAWAGASRIRLRACRLIGAEYENQIAGIENAIRAVEARYPGVEIDNPYTGEWAARKRTVVNWKETADVSTGSTKHLMKFFLELPTFPSAQGRMHQ
jgi:hypothetical protein